MVLHHRLCLDIEKEEWNINNILTSSSMSTILVLTSSPVIMYTVSTSSVSLMSGQSLKALVCLVSGTVLRTFCAKLSVHWCQSTSLLAAGDCAVRICNNCVTIIMCPDHLRCHTPTWQHLNISWVTHHHCHTDRYQSAVVVVTDRQNLLRTVVLLLVVWCVVCPPSPQGYQPSAQLQSGSPPTIATVWAASWPNLWRI